MSELKRCPFCGGMAKLRKQNRTIIEHQTQRNCYVYCIECDGRGKRYLEGNTQEEHIMARQLAVEAWNRRVRGDTDDSN